MTENLLKVKVLVTQLCPTLCDHMDCSLPGSSVHGIIQARRLEWLAIPFSRGIFLTWGLNLGLPLQADSLPSDTREAQELPKQQ